MVLHLTVFLKWNWYENKLEQVLGGARIPPAGAIS